MKPIKLPKPPKGRPKFGSSRATLYSCVFCQRQFQTKYSRLRSTSFNAYCSPACFRLSQQLFASLVQLVAANKIPVHGYFEGLCRDLERKWRERRDRDGDDVSSARDAKR